MKKLVIIGANSFQNKLILKAKKLGYETHVFAWECGDVGEKTADVFYPVSIVEKEEILEKCREIQPEGVCTIASDLAAITVNYIADGLGLTCNPPEIMEQCTNKYAMRKCFADAGIPTPKFTKTDCMNDAISGMEYPLVIKPTDRSGSRSITKVYKEEELLPAIERAVGDSFENMAIVEEYIRGDEYSMETISYEGEHHFLTITKKYTTGEPNFIETGHVQPADLSAEVTENAKKMIFSALDALGVQNGAGHAEFRVDEKGNVRIIEIGARMGGDCIGSDLVQLSTGYDFVKMVIDVACGKEPDFTKNETVYNAEIRFIFGEEDLAEFEKIKEKNPNRIYFESEIEKNDAVQDSSSRWGYYILIDEREDVL